MQVDEKKNLIKKGLGQVVKKLRGEQSQFIFSSENDISCSIISTVERGIKDPQLTTLFRIAEAFDMKASEFVKLIEEELPKDFTFIDR